MKKNFVVQSDTLLLPFLSDCMGGVSINALKVQLKRKEIKVNGVRTTENIRLSPQDSVEIFLPIFMNVTPTIKVVYEDDFILIADKPVLMDVENHLTALLKQSHAIIRPVHRLDRNTTGLVIVAKCDEAYDLLCAAIKNRTITKEYMAEVFFSPPKQEDTLTAYLVKDAKNSYCKVYDHPLPNAQIIKTHYKIVSKDGDRTRVLLSAITGRTHQLRAHMAHIKCPIVGDEKYGDSKMNAREKEKFQKLRAVRLVFNGLIGKLQYLNGLEIKID